MNSTRSPFGAAGSRGGRTIRALASASTDSSELSCRAKGVQRQPPASARDPRPHVVGARAVRLDRLGRAAPGMRRGSVARQAEHRARSPGAGTRGRRPSPRPGCRAGRSAARRRAARPSAACRAASPPCGSRARGPAPRQSARTRSKSPTEAPPRVTIRSAPAASAKVAARLSACRGRSAAAAPLPPAASSIAFRPKSFEETIWSGPGRVAGHHQLVAGRDQRHHRPPRHRRPRRRSSRRAAPPRPGASRRGARERGRRGEVAAGRADVRLPVAVGADDDARRRRASTSSWITTMSAPSGTGAPVKMRTASPGADRPAKRPPGGRRADRRASRAPAAGVGAAHRVAVHRRGGEGRLVARGDHVAGEHPAGGLGERHLLGAERREERASAGRAPRRR